MSSSKTLGMLAVGDHACVVLDSDEQHWEVAADFVAEGFRRGEQVIFFDGRRTAEPMKRRLHEDNIDVARYLNSGQMVLVGPEQTAAMWTMTPDEVAGQVVRTVEQSRLDGWPALRVTDEPVGARERPAGFPLAEYDKAVHLATRDRPVTVLCQVERDDWSTAELTGFCDLHPVEVATPSIYDDGLLRITRTAPYTTRVAGEIDVSNRHQVQSIICHELEQALRAGASEVDEIELHFESLRFADVTTIAQFVQAAEGFPQSHQLVLYGVQPGLRRVLDRCGAAFTAQLQLRDTVIK